MSNSTHPTKLLSRKFKGIWIPSQIWLYQGINALEKSLWAEIESLTDDDEGGCYASNAYLCEFCGVEERRLQVMLSNLKKQGLLIQVSYDGKKRILRTLLPNVEIQGGTPPAQKCTSPPAQKCTSPHIYIDTSLDVVCAGAPPEQKKDMEKIAKKGPRGKAFFIKKEEFYQRINHERKDWTNQQIEEAWEVLKDYDNPINDWFALVEGIVKNKPKFESLKKQKEFYRNRREQCQMKKENKKEEIMIEYSESKSNRSKDKSDQGTSGQSLVDWSSLKRPNK